jgi:hypothetical protein
MKIIKWWVKEILYFPRFLFLCLLALIFGIFNYKKGLILIQKLL